MFGFISSIIIGYMKINLSEIKGVIFDMDGVIVNNYTFHLDAWAEFCRKHQIAFSRETFTHQFFGKNNNDILNALFGRNLSGNEVRVLGEEKESIYRKLYSPHIKPLNGLIPFLDYLNEKGNRIAVASSAPQSNIDFTIKRTGIIKYVDVIANGDMVHRGKPHPEIFLKAAEMLKINPGECLVFEDSFSGIDAAESAGMRVVAVATTHEKSEHRPINDIISDFVEIL